MTAPDPEPLPITVCTLCLNEADNLPRCLDQSAAFAEWIVLDTGSTDDSIAIAKEHGARVETSPWLGFSETRRAHFEMATQPWILWIDADEEVTPEFVRELRDLLSHDPDLPHAAYEINRLMYFEGRWIRHGDWFPDWVPRLFRTDAWELPKREVHESLTIHGSTGKLQTPVPHYSYKNRADREARVDSYVALWARQEAQRDRRAGPLTPFSRAAWRYFRGLVLKRGFLDGRVGFFIAWSNAVEVYRKYQALRVSKTAPHEN